jgi:hypothetical protein
MAGIVALRRHIGEALRDAPASTGDAGTDTGVVPQGGMRAATGLTLLVRRAGLAGLVRPASVPEGETGAGTRILPVLPELRPLLPGGGLRRGSTVAVTLGGPGTGQVTPGSAGVVPGSTSVLLALLVAASMAGSWCAVVGMPALGLVAAAELGIVLDRLALVPDPGLEWPSVVAALLDGVDVVVTAPPGPVAAVVSSRLAARARQRGSVLVPYGRWTGADVVLEPVGGGWQGLGQGWGRLRRRELVIGARGRGAAARPREVTVWLPDHTGALAALAGTAEPSPEPALRVAS